MAIINARVIKLIVAIAIPAGMVWGFMSAQKHADKEIAEFHTNQTADPTKQNVEIKGYELKEVDDQNNVRWQLKADLGTRDNNTHMVNLTGITVEYYKDGQVKMKLSAPTGEANEQTNHVKLASSSGHRVVAEGDGGKTHMETSSLELSKNNQFIATDGVNINLPGVAKISGNRAEGNINISELNNFKIIGNTHAEIVVN
ncbi:MAG: LPS export ABC transporter periplasmic protein LptC [Candidatus Obscuribacterales bacterium]|nr:LPS export ABC transporter periplasmic protein LptC [Candidatus Obscuribacterales bacterium]